MVSISSGNMYVVDSTSPQQSPAEAKRCEQRKLGWPTPYIYLPTQSLKRDSEEVAPLLAAVRPGVGRVRRGIMGRGVCIKFLLVCNLELPEQFLNLKEGSTADVVGDQRTMTGRTTVCRKWNWSSLPLLANITCTIQHPASSTSLGLLYHQRTKKKLRPGRRFIVAPRQLT